MSKENNENNRYARRPEAWKQNKISKKELTQKRKDFEKMKNMPGFENKLKRASNTFYIPRHNEGTDIHHIIPLEFGGKNECSNFIRLPRKAHQLLKSKEHLFDTREKIEDFINSSELGIINDKDLYDKLLNLNEQTQHIRKEYLNYFDPEKILEAQANYYQYQEQINEIYGVEDETDLDKVFDRQYVLEKRLEPLIRSYNFTKSEEVRENQKQIYNEIKEELIYLDAQNIPELESLELQKKGYLDKKRRDLADYRRDYLDTFVFKGIAQTPQEKQNKRKEIVNNYIDTAIDILQNSTEVIKIKLEEEMINHKLVDQYTRSIFAFEKSVIEWEMGEGMRTKGSKIEFVQEKLSTQSNISKATTNYKYDKARSKLKSLDSPKFTPHQKFEIMKEYTQKVIDKTRITNRKFKINEDVIYTYQLFNKNTTDYCYRCIKDCKYTNISQNKEPKLAIPIEEIQDLVKTEWTRTRLGNERSSFTITRGLVDLVDDFEEHRFNEIQRVKKVVKEYEKENSLNEVKSNNDEKEKER